MDLLKASVRGDTVAFEAIVKEYQSFICAITFSATGDVEKSEELAQETFVSAWKDLGQLKDLSKFRSWLAGVARNLVKNSLRSRRRDPLSKAVPIDEIEDAATGDSEPAETAIGKERQVVVREALQRIPEIYREPLVLFYRQEQSVKEVAKQLELSEDTVKQRLSRGRNLLKEQIAGMVESTIRRTGPGKTFTSIVMGSVTALVVKTSAAATAEVSAAGLGSARTPRITTVTSGVSAKLITAAAAAAVAIGAVLIYRHIARSPEEPLLPETVNTMSMREKIPNTHEVTVSGNMNVRSAADENAAGGQKEGVIAVDLSAAAAEHETDDSAAEDIDWQPEHYNTNDGPYNHLVFSDGGTVFLARREADRFEVTAVDSVQGRGGYYSRGVSPDLLTVARGKAYVMMGDEHNLIEVDLVSGQRRIVATDIEHYCQHWSGRVYCVQGARLVVYDFKRFAWRDIMSRPFGRFLKFPGHRRIGKGYARRMAISLDERHLAFTEPNVPPMRMEFYVDEVNDVGIDVPLYSHQEYHKAKDLPDAEPQDGDEESWVRYHRDTKLVVLDLTTGEQVRMPTPFASPFGTSSGGGYGNGGVEPPPIVWHDDNTVLVARGDRFFEGRLWLGIAAVDIGTGQMYDVAGIPGIAGYHNAIPGFRVGKEGRVRVTLITEAKEGFKRWVETTYKVNLEEDSLLEEVTLAPDLSIGSMEGTPCILYKDSPIEQSKHAALVEVSPDASKVAWSKVGTRTGPGRMGVYIFDVNERTVRKVTDGRIEGKLMWVADEDMVAAELPQLPSGWQRIKTKPWTLPKPISQPPEVVNEQPSQEQLPPLVEVLHLGFSTIKPTYELGDSVELTLWIRNQSANDYTFKLHPELSSPLEISISHPNGVIDADFGTKEQPFPFDPLELKAYKSVSSTRTIEPNVAGEYTATARLCFDTEDWPGQVTCPPTKFTVKEPIEYERYVKQEFDRGIAEVRNGTKTVVEFKKLAGELGPTGLKYLIAEIEAETDKRFRAQMGGAIRQMLSPEALPFFKKCFTQEMKIDHETIVDCLVSLYYDENAQDETLEVFFLALTHENVRYRRNAVERLVRIKDDPRIVAALAESVHEDDAEIGETSARYLAASEGLTLADWFAAVEKEPTYTRYATSKWILHILDKEWNMTYGDLPELGPDHFSKNSEGLDEFLSIIRAWEIWARKNPNSSARIFHQG
ncbi:MAG TPA: sigma-70 family RNA polymerase sigma factor [Sedimentisphaerales bacterium]|nr:sigma-70 family RNA polymerase sigma factor [Sedimentisphaerales bacterium]